MKRLAAFAVLAFALAGCGSSKSSDEQPATTNPTSPPSMATTAACEPPSGASTSPQKGSSAETMYLTGVVIKPGECTSSVLFELEPEAQAPGYEVSYQPADTAKIEDASGNPVEIAGDAFLVVKLTPAMTAKIDGEQVTKTYTGPRRLPGSDPITEVVKTGDFEGVVTWVIGLDRERPFSAEASDGTLAVVVAR
ncbi:MAG TPA: hypothetical protein VKC65_03170 [Gaiellaceae bacterium]|nr:hypothetical protein [Gaiellaceae bacterium]